MEELFTEQEIQLLKDALTESGAHIVKAWKDVARAFVQTSDSKYSLFYLKASDFAIIAEATARGWKSWASDNSLIIPTWSRELVQEQEKPYSLKDRIKSIMIE